MNRPKLTIGVVSCNRLLYLRALLESMSETTPLDNVEVIVVDNGSIEPGLREYVTSLDFVTHKVFRDQRAPATEAVDALNTILDLTSASHVLLLTDDVQFIVSGGSWIDDVLDVSGRYAWLGSVMPIALRHVTIAKHFDSGLGWRLFPRRFPRRLEASSRATRIICFGRHELGITHSALGVTPIATWRTIGPFRARKPQTVEDAGGGAEEDVVRRYRRAGLRLRKGLLEVPVLAEIITDPRGTQARVRGNRRYGRYFAPPDGRFYYRIWTDAEAAALPRRGSALAFEEIVHPLGFELPYDREGNRLKNPLGPNDPFDWIHPSVQGTDLP